LRLVKLRLEMVAIMGVGLGVVWREKDLPEFESMPSSYVLQNPDRGVPGQARTLSCRLLLQARDKLQQVPTLQNVFHDLAGHRSAGNRTARRSDERATGAWRRLPPILFAPSAL
jgi:hypothetical protein